METEERKCVKCEYYWVKTKEQLDSKNGFCRRYPPTVAVALIPQTNKFSQQIEIIRREDSAYPTVMEDSFCGEYKAKVVVKE